MPSAVIKPTAVHWRINSPCNRRCPFCYGPHKIKEASLEDSLPVLDKLVHFGIESVIITGGEPTLSKKFDAVLQYLHARDVKVVLYTNCDFWDDHDEVLSDCLHTLCIPLEGASWFVHDKQRGEGSMRNILKVMNRYAHGGGPFEVKVGTVVGSHNVAELPGLLYLLDKYKIKIWKLYEYIPYDDRPLQEQWTANNQSISNAQYRAATQAIVNTVGRKTPIGLSSELDRDQSYFMLQPNLDVIVPVKQPDGKFADELICNATTSSMEEVQRLWMQTVDFDRYVDNLQAAAFV
ncbi:MAG: radical SAM protein [Kamptonema sp. SIO1D9]|nr:radical SAM protein [Kamptonema sp. SIO1D9]